MNQNLAIDTAARFGDIPFVEFTKELVTGVFDSLVEAHLIQMEEYSNFVASLTQDLSTYINNTQDDVSFQEISDFILNYDLPEMDTTTLETVLGQLESPADPTASPGISDPGSGQPASADTWWGGLINGLAPVVSDLVDKIDDPSENLDLQALVEYNNDVLAGAEIAARTVPNYKNIHNAVAALVASNKFSLLNLMSKQGILRLVVTEGEIETKLTFSTWNNNTRSYEHGYKRKIKDRNKSKDVRGGGILGLFRSKRKRKNVNRTVTVNTAKSYQRDSSGTRVDIFGRVLIKFKSDYAPLNG